MARKIVCTRYSDEPGRDIEVTAVFWCDVPVARRAHWVRHGNTGGMVASTTALTIPETNAIQSGAVREYVENHTGPAGTTGTVIMNFLASRHAELQAQTNGYNPWKFAGTHWDGATWTVVQVT